MNVNNQFSSIEQIRGQYLNNPDVSTTKVDTKGHLSFEEALNLASATKELKFSKHAGERLIARNINLTSGQLDRLKEGTQLAKQKGITESLMIMDQMAFIVNIPNNTVVTAIDNQSGNSNVFTNIDGAVIV